MRPVNEAHEVLEEIADIQGWDEESTIIHLTGFITEQGLVGEFEKYLQVVAKEENSY